MLIYQKLKEWVTIIVLILFGQIAIGQTTIQEIIDEANKSAATEIPLPLASSWQTGSLVDVYPWNVGLYFTLDEQVDLISNGHHFLPTIGLAAPSEWYTLSNDYYSALEQFKTWGLPLTIVCTQWEQELYQDSSFFNLPFVDNPNLWDTSGVIIPSLSPMAPDTTWYQIGKKWSDSTELSYIQSIYSDPPLVIMLSNNEALRLTWINANRSQRFVDSYGLTASDSLKRAVFQEGWSTKYIALQNGMRDNFSEVDWRNNVKFVGYGVNDVGHFARWDGWIEYSLYAPGRIGTEHNFWDGGSPSYYLNPWEESLSDFNVYSPQVEFMNLKMILDETRLDKPEYWSEFSVWDGYNTADTINPSQNKRVWYNSIGQTFSPERYKGWIQFGMWLIRPRVVREFRGWAESREDVGIEYFDQILDVVDTVYSDSLLKRFWREGELVKNSLYTHPYQSNVPPEYQTIDRWYLLDTDIDNLHPWTLATEIPVYALAREINSGPSDREWLIYAYAPQGEVTNVTIKIPDGSGGYVKQITVDVPVEGAFYYESESTVDVNEESLVSNIELFPNPTSGFINLNMGYVCNDVHIIIKDIIGNIIIEEHYEQSQIINMDASRLTAGIYVITLTTGNQNKTMKLIKQ